MYFDVTLDINGYRLVEKPGTPDIQGYSPFCPECGKRWSEYGIFNGDMGEGWFCHGCGYVYDVSETWNHSNGSWIDD